MAARKKAADAEQNLPADTTNIEPQKTESDGQNVVLTETAKGRSRKRSGQVASTESTSSVSESTEERPRRRAPRRLNPITALKNIADEAFREDFEEGGRILSIDGTLKAETDTKKLSDTVIELADSYRDRKILTGVISQIEEAQNGNPYASLMYKGMIKIILPASEFLNLGIEALAGTTQEKYHAEKLLLFKRLNSEIDFIVENRVDTEERVAAGSRRAAMKQKQHMYWLSPDRNGRYIIGEGYRVEARIVSVNQRSLTVEIFGVEAQIRVEDVSPDHIQSLMDCSEYQVGKTIPVKIMHIDKDDPDHIHVEASIKLASSSKSLDRIIGELDSGTVKRVVGVVENASVYGIFVRLSNGIQCLCHTPAGGRYPIKGDKVVVKIDRVERDNSQVSGFITRVL